MAQLALNGTHGRCPDDYHQSKTIRSYATRYSGEERLPLSSGPPLKGSAPSWSTEDVRTLLSQYGRTPEVVQVQQMDSWWFNLVLRLQADEEELVLRRYGMTPPEEVQWELAVLEFLAMRDFPTYSPLLRCDGTVSRVAEFRGKPAILYPYVKGQQACDQDWSLAIAETARLIAQLHELTAGLKLPFARARSGTEERRVIRELVNLISRRGIAKHESALRVFIERAQCSVRSFEERIAPHLADLPTGVVHHDAGCKNILFNNDKLVALIDFDDACEGFLVADVAVMLANWADDPTTGTKLDLAKAVTVVKEYEHHRELTAAERGILPDSLLLFLIADAAGYIHGQLELGVDGNIAVNECLVYRQFLDHANDDTWFASLRKELWGTSN